MVKYFKYPRPSWASRLSVKLFIHVLRDAPSDNREPQEIIPLSGDKDFFVIGKCFTAQLNRPSRAHSVLPTGRAPECDVVLLHIDIRVYHALLQPKKGEDGRLVDALVWLAFPHCC